MIPTHGGRSSADTLLVKCASAYTIQSVLTS
nr:MAG TPA: cytochrome c-type biogenesis protein [Caudoviricetes sp.]